MHSKLWHKYSRLYVSLRNERVLSRILKDESVKAEELPKETVSKSCIERSYIAVSRTKVLPGRVEPKSSTNRNDGLE